MRGWMGWVVVAGLLGAPDAWALKCKSGPLGASVDGQEEVPLAPQILVGFAFLEEKTDLGLTLSARGQKPVALKIVEQTPASVVVSAAGSLAPNTAYTLASKAYPAFSASFTTGAVQDRSPPAAPRVTSVERHLERDNKFAQVDALVVGIRAGSAAFHEVQLSIDGSWVRVFGDQTIRVGSVPCRTTLKSWSSAATVVKEARVRAFDHAGNPSDWVPFEVPKPKGP